MSPIKLIFIFAILIQTCCSSKLDYLAYKLLSSLYDDYQEDESGSSDDNSVSL